MTFAHIGGMPVEEVVLQLAPAAVALVASLRLGAERARRRWVGRGR